VALAAQRPFGKLDAGTGIRGGGTTEGVFACEMGDNQLLDRNGPGRALCMASRNGRRGRAAGRRSRREGDRGAAMPFATIIRGGARSFWPLDGKPYSSCPSTKPLTIEKPRTSLALCRNGRVGIYIHPGIWATRACFPGKRRAPASSTSRGSGLCAGELRSGQRAGVSSNVAAPGI